MTTLDSYWRCDADGESWTVQLLGLTIRHADGEIEQTDGIPPDADVLVESFPCPICGGPMRRVVSLADLRDWETQFS